MPRTRKTHDLTDEQLQTLIDYHARQVEQTRSVDRKLRSARALRDYSDERLRRHRAQLDNGGRHG